MATLTLKNVPEKLVAALKDRAAQNRRSLNQEAMLRLERSVSMSRPDIRKRIASLRRLHKRLTGFPPMTDAFLDRAKNAGRP
jgi:plasmid stability protein